ncbi:hypothetical protein Bca101_033983 [Brassica carinata]
MEVVHDVRGSSSPGVCCITGSATVCSDHKYKGTLDVFVKIIRQVRVITLSCEDQSSSQDSGNKYLQA